METSLLVAKILGLVYVVIGLAFLLNGAYYKKAIEDMMKNSGFMFLGGIMALVVGFLIVNAHNVWVKDWTVLVTIIGWIAMLKGVLIFLAPKFLVELTRSLLKNMTLIGVIISAMGLVFCYFGIFA